MPSRMPDPTEDLDEIGKKIYNALTDLHQPAGMRKRRILILKALPPGSRSLLKRHAKA